MTQLLTSYLSYFGMGLGLTALFMTLYTLATPYKELHLIREGNTAAALSFGGALLGFVLTFASSGMHAANLMQFLTWSAIGGAMQILAFLLGCFVIRGVAAHINNGNTAVGLALSFLNIGVGVLNATALT